MYSHSDIWRLIDRVAATFGYSPSGLAKKAGLDPTAFNKSKRSADGKPRWPSTESIAKILAVTGMTMTEFFSLADQDDDGVPRGGADRAIPLIGLAQAGRNGFFDPDGHPAGSGWDQVRFPGMSGTEQKNAYALEISGDSMAPLYREGDIIVVCPDTGPRRGDRVVVKTRKGEIMAKELVRQTASKIELRSLNPAHDDLVLRPDDVAWIARILWISQ